MLRGQARFFGENSLLCGLTSPPKSVPDPLTSIGQPVSCRERLPIGVIRPVQDGGTFRLDSRFG